MQPRDIALAITGFLPGWLSSFVLASVFLSVWLTPHWFGWQNMASLQVLVFLDVASVYGLLLLFTGRDERFAWLPVLPVAVLLGVFAASLLNVWLGMLLSLHIAARVAGVWSDLRTVEAVLYELLVSIMLMGLAWLAVGLLPLPALAWSEAVVPSQLWWQVISWGGDTVSVPFALPAWGFLYYVLIASADRLHVAERLARLLGPFFR